jgi:hypothetical protein
VFLSLVLALGRADQDRRAVDGTPAPSESDPPWMASRGRAAWRDFWRRLSGKLKIRVKSGHKVAGWAVRARLVISPIIPLARTTAILLRI